MKYSMVPTESLTKLLEKAYKYEALSQYGVSIWWNDYEDALKKYKITFCAYHPQGKFDPKTVTLKEIAEFCTTNYEVIEK